MTLKDVRMVHGGINMSFFFLYFFLFAFFYRNDTERLRRDGLALDAVIQPRLYSHCLSMSLSLSRYLSMWYRLLNNYLSLHHVASFHQTSLVASTLEALVSRAWFTLGSFEVHPSWT